MEKRSGIEAVHNFWEQVWQSPQNYDAIDDLVVPFRSWGLCGDHRQRPGFVGILWGPPNSRPRSLPSSLSYPEDDAGRSEARMRHWRLLAARPRTGCGPGRPRMLDRG